jgi:hypothetical protein
VKAMMMKMMSVLLMYLRDAVSELHLPRFLLSGHACAAVFSTGAARNRPVVEISPQAPRSFAMGRKHAIALKDPWLRPFPGRFVCGRPSQSRARALRLVGSIGAGSWEAS